MPFRNNSAFKSKLPLLDIHQYYSNPALFVEELRKACHTVGFFLLQHDIPYSITQRQLDEGRIFFDKDVDSKLEISYEQSPSFRGFMKFGVENTAGATDLREQIEWATEYKSAECYQKGTDSKKTRPVYERLKEPSNPWPSCQPTLEVATRDYVHHACRIADHLREALCLALELEKHALQNLFRGSNDDDNDQPHWVLKLVSYPTVPPSEGAQSANNPPSFGVGGHTDTNFLTLVLQDDIGGLQVFSSGDWHDVPSDLGPGTLVCNLGEQAEILSHGYFLATPHRVLANTSGRRNRISVPLFYNPRLSAKIEPLAALGGHKKEPDENNMTDNAPKNGLKWQRPQEYDNTQHWRRNNNSMLASVGDNTFKSLARSHPVVFHRHHPDLVLLGDGRIVQRGSIGGNN